jgi:nucleotide-binding universal stress UspA family protein
MKVRTILTPVTGADEDLAGIEAAFTLSAHLGGAHVEGLHAHRDARDALAYIGEGMTGAMIEELITTAEEESAQSTKRAQRDFSAACEKAGFVQHDGSGDSPGARTAHLTIETGPEEELFALRGRVADMIVVTRVAKDGDPGKRATLEGALLESGRPLFIVPPEGLHGPLATAAIAWNGSAEVARAVSQALPLLAEAEKVFILIIEEGLRPGPSPDDLVAYLARHGIAATIHDTASNHLPTGEALLSDAETVGADFLVMGAYTHSRLRRMIMGSATEHVLSTAALPILMIP